MIKRFILLFITVFTFYSGMQLGSGFITYVFEEPDNIPHENTIIVSSSNGDSENSVTKDENSLSNSEKKEPKEYSTILNKTVNASNSNSIEQENV